MVSAIEHLKAVADTTRLRIMCAIDAHPGICVCQLVETLRLPQGTISKALGTLKKAGLVNDTREGLWVRYDIAAPSTGFPLKEILSSVLSHRQIKKDLEKLSKVKKIPLEKICSNKPWRK